MFPVSFHSGSWILRVEPRRCSVIDPVTSPTGKEAQQIYQEIHFKNIKMVGTVALKGHGFSNIIAYKRCIY